MKDEKQVKGTKDFAQIHSGYKKYKSDIDKKYDEKDINIKRIYEEVKQEYLDDENLDVNLERVYLKNKLSGFQSESFDYFTTMMIIVFTAIASAYLSKLEDFWQIFCAGVCCIVCIGIQMYISRKIIHKENKERIYFSMCLDVIDEIGNTKK